MPPPPAIRISQFALETVSEHQTRIRTFVHAESVTLTTACTDAGLTKEIAEVCAGLLASMLEDLLAVSRLPKKDFERTKRKRRILSVTDEPMAYALKLAIAASPVNGRAAVDHWDVICEQYEVGKLAWLLGMDTDTAWRYGRKVEKRQ